MRDYKDSHRMSELPYGRGVITTAGSLHQNFKLILHIATPVFEQETVGAVSIHI